jgi:hypothetical protein
MMAISNRRFAAKTRLVAGRQAVATNPSSGIAHYALGLELLRVEENVAGVDVLSSERWH